MNHLKIGFGEALCVLLIVTISHVILTLPKAILESQGSGSLLNVVYITILAFLFIFLLVKLFYPFQGKDILDVAKFLGGDTLKFMLGIAFIIYLLFVASLLVRNTSESFKTMYLQNTPIPYLIFALLVGASYTNQLRSKSIIQTNLIVVPGIIAVLALLFMASVPDFNAGRAFPVLGYGTKTIFVDGFFNVYAFSGIVYLLFMMPLLKNYQEFSKLSFAAVSISSIFIFFTILALLLIFPIDISSGSNVPIYMQARRITIGDFIQRSDALFVIIWFVTLLSYLSIITVFITNIFQKITKIENRSSVSNCFLAILFGISLLYRNIIQVRSFQSSIYQYTFVFFVLGTSLLLLVLANIKILIKSKKERKIRLE